MYFVWKPEYVFGLKEIDSQHRHFVGILDRLYDLIISGSSRDELSKTLDELINYAGNHFKTEEKYFDEFNYEGAADHKEEHRELAEKISNLKKRFEVGTEDISVELIDFLEDWLVQHLLNLDSKYVDCFRQHGLD